MYPHRSFSSAILTASWSYHGLARHTMLGVRHEYHCAPCLSQARPHGWCREGAGSMKDLMLAAPVAFLTASAIGAEPPENGPASPLPLALTRTIHLPDGGGEGISWLDGRVVARE